ncbi:hypothetical protein LAZ67_16002394 [Cordylochernes scorpioides]|uniref:Mos1 transposase HTH domain-containing protein n=1 Tax=Cordylochernes scorpioides TaxID=51811 RepID=A0ABY6LBY6_9ARAC|nr:hypothetical protein LAZ67_16002394 [Cordylochernes scorpioides]
MEQKLKQRICIEFCVKLQISETDTFEMLNKAFPNNAPKRTTVFEWHSRFKAGRISIEDDPRQGRPTFQRTDENVQNITDLIKENPRTTLLELEQDTDISKTTIGRIVTEDLRLKKTPAKFIPRFLTNKQKLCRLATCEDMLEMTRTDPEWKDKIITGDETWVYGYDPETKRQSAEWRGQGKRFEKKRPEKWTNGDWILHHDNARPHTAHLVTSFLAKNGTEILPQPPYSPDIAPNDFFLFPKLKAVLKGRHFDTREDIIEKSLQASKSIPKEAYKNCFDNWEKRWRCSPMSEDTWDKHPRMTAKPWQLFALDKTLILIADVRHFRATVLGSSPAITDDLRQRIQPAEHYVMTPHIFDQDLPVNARIYVRMPSEKRCRVMNRQPVVWQTLGLTTGFSTCPYNHRDTKLDSRQSEGLFTEIEDQRICIKFCVKNGFKEAEIFWMLQTAYGDTVMSRRRVFEWYKRFKEGREETADNERSGRPSTSTTPEKVDKVLELVRED